MLSTRCQPPLTFTWLLPIVPDNIMSELVTRMMPMMSWCLQHCCCSTQSKLLLGSGTFCCTMASYAHSKNSHLHVFTEEILLIGDDIECCTYQWGIHLLVVLQYSSMPQSWWLQQPLLFLILMQSLGQLLLLSQPTNAYWHHPVFVEASQ